MDNFENLKFVVKQRYQNRSTLVEQNLVENAKIEKLKWYIMGILDNVQRATYRHCSNSKGEDIRDRSHCDGHSGMFQSLADLLMQV